jgi:hypothetical protein
LAPSTKIAGDEARRMPTLIRPIFSLAFWVEVWFVTDRE